MSRWRFDEGTGGTIYDMDNGLTGTVNGTAAWVAGKLGPHAIHVDATTDGSYTVADNAAFKPAAFTLGVWIQLQVADAANFVQIVSCNFGTGGGAGRGAGDVNLPFHSYQLWLENTQVRGCVRVNGTVCITAPDLAGNGLLVVGEWTWVGLRWRDFGQGGRTRMHIFNEDGSVRHIRNGGVAPIGDTIDYDSGPLSIGHYEEQATSQPSVYLDDLRIFDQHLNPTEMADVVLERQMTAATFNNAVSSAVALPTTAPNLTSMFLQGHPAQEQGPAVIQHARSHGVGALPGASGKVAVRAGIRSKGIHINREGTE